MDTTTNGWNIFEADTPILRYSYSFGPGMANALAIGGADGVIVVSPPRGVPVGVYDDLRQYGQVAGLVASNAFHYMGIPEWKRRFPDARVFAPEQSIARVARKTKLPDIQPLREAASIVGSHVELIDMPHYKTGELLLRVRSTCGVVWYVTDFLMNMSELPTNPVVRLVFKLTRSAPGLRFNNIAPLFMVKDKAALKRWLALEFDRAPPGWLIPAHGDIVEVRNREAVRRIFAESK